MASAVAPHTIRSLRPLAVLVVALCALGTAAAQQDFQTVNGLKIPAFPNNIVAFPNRDFVHLDGYTQYAKDVDPTLRVEIWQGPDFTKAIGAAIGTVSGDAVAFEINHPGALCWGNGLPSTDPLSSITPDIQIGDKITVKHGLDVISEMIVADAKGDTKQTNGVTDVRGVWSVSGPALTLTGDISSDLDINVAEVRVVAPGLRDRGLNRDVRVNIGGPAKPEGLVNAFTTLNFGEIVAGRRKWQAVFTFDNSTGQAASNAQLTFDSGIPSISFSAITDPSGNPQATTITEFLEAGGSGVPGVCPPGPAASAPKAGTFSVVATATAGQAKVLWTTPQDSSPQAPARTGFVVSARANSAATPTKFTEVGQYITNIAETSTVLTLPAASAKIADYTFRVRSEVTGEQLSAPFPQSTGSGSTTGTAPAQQCTKPNVTESATTSQVLLAATPNVPIYYTTDNTSALADGAFVADTAKTYNSATGIPIPAGGLTLSWVAFGTTGDCSASAKPHPVAAAATPNVTVAPNISTLSEGRQLSIFTAWSNSDAAASSFVVKVFKGTATAPPTVDISTPTALPDSFNASLAATSATFPQDGTKLKDGDSYWFRVAGVNADGKLGPWSAFNTKALTVGPETDAVVVTQNRYKAGSDWRIAGTVTAVGTRIDFATGNYFNMTGSKPIANLGPINSVAPAVAGAAADWSVRLVKNTVPNLPLGTTIYISSAKGGKATSNTAARRRRQLL